MKNKKIIKYFTCLLLLTLIITGCKKEIEVKDGSKVAVSMKGTKITATEYYNKIKERNISLLVEMIDKTYLDKNYKLNEKDEESIKKQIDSIKEAYKDENLLNQILRQQIGVNDIKEFEELSRLELQRQNAVKEYIRKDLKEKEIKDYYNKFIFGKVKASHILITPNINKDSKEDEIKEAEEIALKEAKEIIEKLNKGEKFDKLAKKHSKDKGTAENGGDLGYFEPDEMVKEFSDAVKELKNGEYTKKPIKSKYGYHIILKKDSKKKPELKEVKKDIEEKLVLEKLNNDPLLYNETLIKIRKDNGLTWNDTVLEKEYNDFNQKIIDNIKEQIEKQNEQTQN